MLLNLSCSPALIGSFFLACVIPVSCLSWHVCTRVIPAAYLAPVCAVAELDQPKPVCNTFFPLVRLTLGVNLFPGAMSDFMYVLGQGINC